MLLWMIFASLLYSASLVIWFGVFGLSFMAFDAGVSTGPIIFVGAVGLYSIIALLTIIWSWIEYKRGQHRRAGVITLAPIAYILLFALISQIGVWSQR